MLLYYKITCKASYPLSFVFFTLVLTAAINAVVVALCDSGIMLRDLPFSTAVVSSPYC